MKRIAWFTGAILLVISSPGHGQIVESWSARYNGPGNNTDVPTGIVVDDLGNIFVTGSTRAGGFATEDFTTIKYTPAGDTLWVRRLDGTGGGSDFANALALGPDGSLYVTGQSWGSTSGYDYLTVKYSSSGDTLWTRRYNG